MAAVTDPPDRGDPDTDEILVRRIEGRIGAVLRPLDTVRLPALGRPRYLARRRAPR